MVIPSLVAMMKCKGRVYLGACLSLLYAGLCVGLYGGMLAYPTSGWAEAITLDLGQNLSAHGTNRILSLFMIMTVLSLAPSLLMMLTGFVRIVVVLSLVRNALGLQQTPPNAVLVGLALFLTLFVMTPTLQVAYREGVLPFTEGRVTQEEALVAVGQPFHVFMRAHTRPKTVALFTELSGTPPTQKEAEIPWTVLVPSFMVSELTRAFEIGFLLFLPFMIIDMAVAALLMAMGMMMVPPATVALPFKLIFFVLVDGWYLVCGSLVKSFGVVG
jgi:flagellar biosynthetic protein FliP